MTTTHKSGESVLQWVGRHDNAVDRGAPTHSLTTKWPCSSGEEVVTTARILGENDASLISRHKASYRLEMIGCPPVP
jgi:hypothetical protein